MLTPLTTEEELRTAAATVDGVRLCLKGGGLGEFVLDKLVCIIVLLE